MSLIYMYIYNSVRAYTLGSTRHITALTNNGVSSLYGSVVGLYLTSVTDGVGSSLIFFKELQKIIVASVSQRSHTSVSKGSLLFKDSVSIVHLSVTDFCLRTYAST